MSLSGRATGRALLPDKVSSRTPTQRTLAEHVKFIDNRETYVTFVL